MASLRNSRTAMSGGSTGGMVKTLVYILVAALAVIPTIIDVNTTGWSSTQVTLFNLIPLFIILGLLVKVTVFK